MAAKRRRVLIVDGYNVLNAWRQGLKGRKVDDARDELTALLSDYAGYSQQQVIVVYDAWMSDRKKRTIEESGPISVVFTQKGETADHYIERLADGYARDVDLGRLEVRVATSDLVEQTVVLGRGATRLSAREMLVELEQVRAAGAEKARPVQRPGRSTVIERVPEDVREKLERMRRG